MLKHEFDRATNCIMEPILIALWMPTSVMTNVILVMITGHYPTSVLMITFCGHISKTKQLMFVNYKCKKYFIFMKTRCNQWKLLLTTYAGNLKFFFTYNFNNLRLSWQLVLCLFNHNNTSWSEFIRYDYL